MNKVHKTIFLFVCSIIIFQAHLRAQAMTFNALKNKFNVPQKAKEVVQYYIDRKLAKKPLSGSGLYVKLYQFFKSRNLTDQEKRNILKSIAFIATEKTNEAALQDKVEDIKKELGKVNVLVEQDVDIEALR